MYYLKSIRPLNLCIVALTQVLIYYIVILPSLDYAEVDALLSPLLFGLLVLDTVLIAASGYVINDIIDEESDRLNNKLKDGYTANKAKFWYGFLVIVSLLITFYVAYKIDNLPLFILHPIAVILLFLYSYSFKKTFLLGNIIVALFCAFVPGILWFAEREAYQAYLQSDVFDLLTKSLIGFMIFGFLATMYRELVKDIEDIKGDSQVAYRTLPVLWGKERAKIATAFFGFILLFTELVWCNATRMDVHLVLTILFITIVILPSIYSIHKLLKAETSSDFKQLSGFIKFIMLTGLLYLLILFFYEFSDKI